MSTLPKILLIEDDPSICRAFERMVRGTVDLTVASSLEDAEEAFPAGGWRAIFVDGCLNHESKLDTAPLVREMRATFPDLLIIACSSEPRYNKELVAGATKGIDKTDLGSEIRQILATE